MGRLRRFLRISAAERRLLIRAAVLLQVISVGMRLLPFRTLRRLLALAQKARAGSRRVDGIPVERIAGAVEAAGRYMPGEKTCLTQALAAQTLLVRQGYPALLHIGAAKGEEGQLRAHAWVESEGRVVIGGHDLGRYAPLVALKSEQS
jgi:hypothetical protein